MLGLDVNNNRPSAKVVEATTWKGTTVWTVQIRYHRMIHGEFMTHRVFSRNASSSRAIPVLRMINQADAFPIVWRANKSGMQAGADLTGWRLWMAMFYWALGILFTRWLSRRLVGVGLHKQWANRWTEPAQWISVVVTATDWSNFFNLRAHEKAQPEIHALAETIRQAMANYSPRVVTDCNPDKVENWHLPYVTQEERRTYSSPYLLARVSAARCARVSYLNHDGSNPEIAKDLQLFSRLVEDPKAVHGSPLEHPCHPLKNGDARMRNLKGWKMFRAIYEKRLQDVEV